MYKNEKTTLIERINRMLEDDEFRNHCHWCKDKNPKFEYEIAIAEKIARLDISQLYINDNLIHMAQPFSEDELD